jgi:hypothetical protein
LRGADADRARDVEEEPTALCRPPWPYVRLKYSCVDVGRRPEEDRALPLRLELERTERPAALLELRGLRETEPRVAELRPALLRPE